MSGARAGRAVGNLPDDLSEFVGRRAEVAAGKRALAQSRLVTLTGPGGIGKTRLALRLASDVRRAFADGAWIVELASLRDSALLAREVARSLGFSDRSTLWAVATLSDHLSSRRALLVLDNCEHLLDACAVLAESILRTCRDVRVLTTSREPLGVTGETVLPVPTMSLPDVTDSPTPDLVLRSEAVRLFASRAAGVLPSFAVNEVNAATVAQLVRRLEGVPLAIELAAVRLRSLAPEQVLDRLQNRFQLLTSGSRTAEPRHQTLEATFEWSYELLADDERTMWRRVAVFAGSFDLEAAEAVCDSDGITRDTVFDLIDGLVAKSILICEPDQVPARYHMLDAVREFGLRKLREAGNEGRLARRHRDWYAGLAAAQEGLGRRQVEWIARLHAEHANLRAALDFCLDKPGEAAAGLRAACDLWLYWGAHGHLTEGRRWTNALLAAAGLDCRLRARGLWVAGYLSVSQRDVKAALPLLEEARHLGLDRDPSAAAYSTLFLGRGVGLLGESERGLALTEEALALHRAGNDWKGVVLALVQLLWMRILNGYLAGTRELFEECVSTCEAHGERWMRSYALWAFGIAAWLEGDADESTRLETEALRLKRDLRDEIGASACIEVLAWIAASQQDGQRAAALLGAAAGTWQSLPGFLPQQLQERNSACREAAQRLLGSGAFDAAFTFGHRMTIDTAIAMTLGEGDGSPKPSSVAAAGPSSSLTDRECQIVALLAAGKSNADIGRTLVVSTRTAETHVRHIMDKLGLSSRAQIAAWAASGGMDSD